MTTTVLLGAAVPAMAGAFGGGDADRREARADTILQELNDRGINATSVEEWGELVRAFVTKPDGSNSSELFDPWTFERVEN